MTEFENIVIGKNSVPSLMITVILMIAIPVIFFVYWRRKHKQETKIGYLRSLCRFHTDFLLFR